MQTHHGPSPPTTMSFPDDFLLQQLQQQIDFYFSPQNLGRDDYLRTLLYQNNGAVPIEVIASFPMIKKIVAQTFLGPAVMYHTDPYTLPPADPNLLRRAVAMNSHTVFVEGMYLVHPHYRVQYGVVPPHTPQRFVGYPPQELVVKTMAGEDASTRTLATVSPTSFASTLNPSADEEEDHKVWITVQGVPDAIGDKLLKKWLAFENRTIPEGFTPIVPVTLEKIMPLTWKLSFFTESEARASMDMLAKRNFKRGGGGPLVCEWMGASPTPATMMYQPIAYPQGEQVYYATAYPPSVLETAQKGMVAVPYPTSTATPVYAWAYAPTPVTPSGAPSAASDSNEPQDVVLKPLEETPVAPSVHESTPDPRFRRTQYRGRKGGKSRKKKTDEFPPLVPLKESSGTEKKGDRGKTTLLETIQKMGELTLHKDDKNERTKE
ncbi:hypothetical protein FisN_6Lh389 [Fistulifera solaris]|uniref:HTH La-type RNA-binding domain-containing protein n=1 Tax=Fistulifera solaris TaxID=1519565 RepID=A0A1Z5JKR8_FISSO|nr:hypothetical protein FisN_6Lh389 [Fistulifera solaris]|eukprot:GAX14607.1 hypothetical protein FisN_6Lh389 [Fistulifera solaris]